MSVCGPVSRQSAGLAELDVTVTSPLGKNLPIDVTATNEDGEAIEFLPTVPGRYKLAITYGGEEVPGRCYELCRAGINWPLLVEERRCQVGAVGCARPV